MNMRPSDCKERSDRSAIHCQDYDPETGEQIILVQQEFAEECDINNIVARALKDGVDLAMPEGLVYGDDSARPRYEQAKQLILQAEESFNSLPAKIRSRFLNEPAMFLEFMDNMEENSEEAIRLGLIENPGLKVEIPPKDVPPVPLLDITGGTDS